MAEGKSQDSWQHTSAILCLIANANRDPKKTRAFKPSDFNPFSRKSKYPDAINVNKENIHILRNAFVRQKG